MTTETMKIHNDVSRDFSYGESYPLEEGGDFAGWINVSLEMVDQTRWDIVYETVMYDSVNEKYWMLQFGRGATELQDHDDFDDPTGSASWTRVYPHKVQVVEWRTEPPLGEENAE